MFLSAIAEEGSVSTLLGYGKIDHLFKANEVEVWKYVSEFVKKHGKVPAEETILAHVGEGLVNHKEPSTYYIELLKQRHIEQEIKKCMKVTAELLGADNKDPVKALKGVADMVMGLVTANSTHMMTDFRDAYDMIIGEYVSQWTKEDDDRLEFGWPSLDSKSGGLVKGDVCGLVGRPGQGKTWQMLYTAMYGWLKTNTAYAKGLTGKKGGNGKGEFAPPQSRLFFSMEMKNLPIAQRMASMLSHIPMFDLDTANLSTKYMSKLKTNLTEVKGFAAPFYIIDGNLTTTVEQMFNIVRQLKPDAVFVDGGYLVKHPNERDRFRRVAENSNLFKQEIAPLCPTVVSWQFARTASKKKKGEKVTGDDVGYSDAIYQDCSLLLGLLESDNVETMVKRKVDVLKGRKGETGSFEVNWRFDGPNAMDFSEIVHEDVSDLQFL
jgi:replicative DNA helicase